MQELDIEGIITAKQRTQANAIINPKYESFMPHPTTQFDDVPEQLNNMTVAMSIPTKAREPDTTPTRQGIPSVIQAQPSSYGGAPVLKSLTKFLGIF